MELQSILTADYLDIVFDNRNKTYGGYELRKHYNRRAMKAITLVVSAALLLIGVHAFASRNKPTVLTSPPVYTPVDPTILDIPPQKKIELPKVQDVPKPVASTIKLTPPKIIKDDLVTEAPPTIEELKDKQIGTVTTDGNGGTEAATTVILTDGKGEPTTGPTIPPVSTEPAIIVEQMPEFNGNVNEYLARNIQYPQMARETQTTGRVVIKFVVNEDGSVSGAKVLKSIGSGCEEEALRVINSMPKWKPGKNNGKAVKVYFTLPVKFAMN